MSRRTEIQVGLTVLAAIAILGWGVSWLKEYSLARKVRVWQVSFPRTGGLGPSDEVQVNGMKMGSVKSMHLAGDHVLVELAIARDVTLTRESRISIRNVGLMGEKVIAVDLRSTGAPWAAQDTIPGLYEKGMDEVMSELAGTASSVKDLTEQISQVVGAPGQQGAISGMMKNMQTTSEQIREMVSENRKALSIAVQNFAEASKTARTLTSERKEQLGSALDHFSSAAANLDRLSSRLDSLQIVLHSLTGKLDRGDGTLGQLVNDRKLYTNLSATVDSLRTLITDVKQHPKRYLKVSIF